MPILARSSAFSRVVALAELRPVHEAFRWLHLHDQQMLQWQMELVAIPAPPFGEQLRSQWMARKFTDAGLENVEIDAIGNVYGQLPQVFSEARTEKEATQSHTDSSSKPVILLSAHLDTVFPADTPLAPVLDHDRISAPGACDNAAGVIGMLAIAHALVQSQLKGITDSLNLAGAKLIFVGNVGEEGEGDLRGVRYLYHNFEFADKIAAHIVLDGAGTDNAVTQALGSRRFEVTILGPGGHSFTDAGTPNPILILTSALANLVGSQRKLETQNGDYPRTTLNVGTIRGGTSVNTIPESASATLDFRSTSIEELVRLEVALHRAVEDAVETANVSHPVPNLRTKSDNGQPKKKLAFAIQKIGDRPAAILPLDSPLLEAIRAVDRHLGTRTELRLGSTDANIPLSLGVPAVSLGAGGDGGGAHTRAEWYSAKNRELGLRRILLLTLTMAEWAGNRSAD